MLYIIKLGINFDKEIFLMPIRNNKKRWANKKINKDCTLKINISPVKDKFLIINANVGKITNKVFEIIQVLTRKEYVYQHLRRFYNIYSNTNRFVKILKQYICELEIYFGYS